MSYERTMELWEMYGDNQTYFAIDTVSVLLKRIEDLTSLVESAYGLED